MIVTCGRWYLRFSLSVRDIEELMAERGLPVDHSTVWPWLQAYAPELHSTRTFVERGITRARDRLLDELNESVNEHSRIAREYLAAAIHGFTVSTALKPRLSVKIFQNCPSRL